MADPDEWIPYREQRWFYNDATPDKRRVAMAVLKEWDMVQPVLEERVGAHLNIAGH